MSSLTSKFIFLVEVLCCTWDGCNSDINSAKLSKFEYEQYLLQQILGSEYDYFISTEKQRPLKSNAETISTKTDESPNSSSFDNSNESDTSNRRFGTFQDDNIPTIKSDGTNKKQKITSSFLSNGFPKNFVPKLQVTFIHCSIFKTVDVFIEILKEDLHRKLGIFIFQILSFRQTSNIKLSLVSSCDYILFSFWLFLIIYHTNKTAIKLFVS